MDPRDPSVPLSLNKQAALLEQKQEEIRAAQRTQEDFVQLCADSVRTPHWADFQKTPAFSCFKASLELMKRGNTRGFTWVDRVGLMRMLIDLQFTKGAGVIRLLRGIGGQGLGSGVSTLLMGRFNIALPAPGTVSAYMQPGEFNTGIFSKYITDLKYRMDRDHLCEPGKIVLKYDEIDLRKGLVLDPKHDYVIGGVSKSGAPLRMSDIIKMHQSDVATHCLVFIATSVDHRHKQVIGWEFTAGLSGKKLLAFVQTAMDKCQEQGLEVSILTSDCLSANVCVFLHFERLGKRISLPDYIHTMKLLMAKIRRNKSTFIMHKNDKISLDVLCELKASHPESFPKLVILRDLFPSDKQKVKPLLNILDAAEALSKFVDNPRALKLAEYLKNVRKLFDVFDVKRVDQRQLNTPGKPVLTMEQRLTMLKEVEEYFSHVRSLSFEFRFPLNCSVEFKLRFNDSYAFSVDLFQVTLLTAPSRKAIDLICRNFPVIHQQLTVTKVNAKATLCPRGWGSDDNERLFGVIRDKSRTVSAHDLCYYLPTAMMIWHWREVGVNVAGYHYKTKEFQNNFVRFACCIYSAHL